MMRRSLFAIALGVLATASEARDPRTLPETTVEYAVPLNADEAWLFRQSGGVNVAEYYVLSTTLRWQVQLHYRDVPGGVDRAAEDAIAAAVANRGRLGPLDIGEVDPDALRRCVLTRQTFSSGVRAASTAFTPTLGSKARPPAIVVSELCDDPGDALRHELVHVSRPWSGGLERRSALTLSVGFFPHHQQTQFFSPSEIDPRLATIKRTYALMTGNPVRSVEQAAAAWQWGKANTRSLPMLTSSAYPRSIGNAAWFDALERTAAARWNGLTMNVLLRRMTQML